MCDHPGDRSPHGEAETHGPLDPVRLFDSGRVAVDVRHHVVVLESHGCLARPCLDLITDLSVPRQQAVHRCFAALDQGDQDVHDRRQHVGLSLPPLPSGQVYGARGHVPLQEPRGHLGQEVVRQFFPLHRIQAHAIVAEVAPHTRVVADLAVVSPCTVCLRQRRPTGSLIRRLRPADQSVLATPAARP